MTYRVAIKNSAKTDLKKLKRSHLQQSFMQVVADLESDPYQPTQSFEKLQPASRGLYSRRINSQHRVVYDVDDRTKTVTIYAAWSHYE
ncbi:Txe/YoeB family addiction module toxin [Bifidobacterium sp. ESL0704]|uniref:Txe/YoeB family addiction module toxin n=1 Tax=Bifidobacterium sp. ESL0704 TaxID=2983219 RepID=UPI0023F69571|nr:Txe/YoeB family addiction module toxin [Bifidobacterium sp. ESL0704]WEV53028.1 Txe/YoeB family addiction module toxin [Bifidobacterium sp. ESL0704]